MVERQPLPRSELEVARIVWERGEATVRQVCDALPQDRELDFFTVQTYLRRLEAKGVLKARREGRTNIYTPAVDPQSVIREAVGDLIERLFGGAALPLVQHLIADRDLTDAEIDSLQERLDELKAKPKGRPRK